MRARIGVLLAVGLALGLAPADRWPAVRGALEARGPEGLGADALECGVCHGSEVAEWRGSRHAVSANNAIFRTAWDARPDGWCLGCHLPVAEEQVRWLGEPAVAGRLRAPDRPDVPVDGVGCAACHLDGGLVVARTSTAAGRLAHPVREEPDFGDPVFCARCHEFPFQLHGPGPFALGQEPSQATVSEWTGSDAAGRGQDCRTCHLPDGAHSFPGAHDPALVRASIALEVRRDGPDRVATLTGDAPHRIPTGDPFRRLELRLFDEHGARAGDLTFRRTFDATSTSWALRDDRTLPPSRGGPSRRELRAHAPDAVRWELWYMFGDRRHEAALQPSDVGYLLHAGPVR